MKNIIRHTHKALRVAVLPVHFAVEKLHHLPKAHIFKKKRHAKVAVGAVIMLSGSALATIHVTILPLFLWHGICGVIHAYGALPLLKVFCEKYDLETIREECERDIRREIAAASAENNKAIDI